MIVTCPSCTTRYFADEAAIGPSGRSVRCASCGHSWFVEAQLVLDQAAPEDLLPEPREPRPTGLTREQVERMRRGATGGRGATAKIRERQQDRQRRERIRTAAIAWGGAGATIAATAAGAVAMREDLAQIWPATASAYAAVGLHVNVYGLEFADLEIERSYDGPTPVLVISGEVRNIGEEAKAPPPLRFALRDEQANELYRWVLRMDEREIPPGGSARFETVVDNPPIQAEDIEATFASLEEALQAGPPRPPAQPPLEPGPEFGAEPLGAPELRSEAAELAPLRAGPLIEELAPRLDALEPPAVAG